MIKFFAQIAIWKINCKINSVRTWWGVKRGYIFRGHATIPISDIKRGKCQFLCKEEGTERWNTDFLSLCRTHKLFLCDRHAKMLR